MSEAHPRARQLRVAVIATVCALIAVLVSWRVMTGISIGDVILIAVLSSPLLIALPRLSAGNRRTYAWMTLAVTPFLIVGITEAVANPSTRAWAAACLFVAFALFVMLVSYLRTTRGAN